jgi:hypothetical protein
MSGRFLGRCPQNVILEVREGVAGLPLTFCGLSICLCRGSWLAVCRLTSRQPGIEKQLAARHLAEGGIAMFDLSSS